MTPEAAREIGAASDVVGYAAYLGRLALRSDQQAHASDNRVETRPGAARLAAGDGGTRGRGGVGRRSGRVRHGGGGHRGDRPRKPEWRALDVTVTPGVSAMQAAAARLGAPLGHDFCAISLSDNLKPWDVVERRLTAAAEGDFVIALFNPASKARPTRIHRGLRPAQPPQGRLDPRRLRPRLRAARRAADPDHARRSGPEPRRYGDAGHRRLDRDPLRRTRRRAALDADPAQLRIGGMRRALLCRRGP